MRKKQCDEARFLNDVKKHEMKIVQDNSVYRHIVFKEPGTNSYMFGLVTWPWHLAYYGDMGDYMFTRIDDMFQFFRHDNASVLYINSGYWAEKCVASCRDGIEEFSPDLFKSNIKTELDEANASKAVRRAVVDDIFSRIDDGEHSVNEALYNFEHDGFRFDDWGYSSKEYTFRFLWCCYAIAWGIKKYDEVENAKNG